VSSARQATLERAALPWLLVVYGVASLGHFTHNAEYLADYPNLPAWLTRAEIYATWVGITTVGLVGYLLYGRNHQLSGLALLAIYAAFGLDGLLHYTRAPFARHTALMNLSILFEVTAAALVLCAAALLAARHLRQQRARA
jgi:hypothetical protein